MDYRIFFRHRAPICYRLCLLVIPLVTVLACRSYFHQKAVSDKALFYQQSLEVMYQRQAQNLPSGSIVFLGDSQIQGLAVTAVSPNSVNFGIGHQKLQTLAEHIGAYCLAQADRIVIGIGINDLLETEEVQPRISIYKLMNGLQRCRNKVLVLGVLPVNEQKLKKNGLNKRIIKFNKELQTAALDASYDFLELFPVLASTQHGLQIDYDLGDGLHLSPKGNKILINQIKNKLYHGEDNEK